MEKIFSLFFLSRVQSHQFPQRLLIVLFLNENFISKYFKISVL